jgi:hypothetical protein
MRWLLIFALASCQRSNEAVMGPPAEMAIAPTSSWKTIRAGDEPMLCQRSACVFAPTAKTDNRLPGIAIGGESGPALVLLGGEFAPLVIPDRTDAAHRVKLSSTGSTLAIDFEGAFSARVHLVRDWVKIALDGRANLVLPSGETHVKGFVGGKPVSSERVTAWSEASIEIRSVDRIEVDTERRGTIVVESDCKPRLIRPRARANTSSFLLRVGPARNELDPAYAPANLEDQAPPCTGTATVSVRSP